ncbi:MAG: hypothetical protein MRY72_02450 [Aquisalinus sp.]|nr:hypothetical protein [Aquisalinus sp.]
MKVILIFTSLLWMLSMNVSAADIHAFFSCGEMTETETIAADNTSNHEHETDCSDDCCGGACLCKASGSSLSLVPHQLDGASSHLQLKTSFTGKLDSFIEALHLLSDPPPRPFS